MNREESVFNPLYGNPTTPSNPIVSICVPTYNHGKFIGPCLDSILAQKVNFPIEIIIGEDNSTDDTRQICIDYADKFPEKINLHLRRREDVIYINDHPTGRFNFIENFKAAKGKYIALLPGDDFWTDPDKLQKQVDFLEAHPDYGLSVGRVTVLEDKTGKTTEKKEIVDPAKNDTYSIRDYLRQLFSHTSTFVFRNNFTLPEWFSDIPFGDQAVVVLAAKDSKIKFHSDFFATYRRNIGSVSNQKRNPQRRYKNRLYYYNTVNDFFDGKYNTLMKLRKVESYLICKQRESKYSVQLFFYKAITFFFKKIRHAF